MVTLTQQGIHELIDVIAEGILIYPEKMKAVLKHLGIDMEHVIFQEFDALRQRNRKLETEIRDLKQRVKRLESFEKEERGK